MLPAACQSCAKGRRLDQSVRSARSGSLTPTGHSKRALSAMMAMEPGLLAAGTRRGMGECSVVIGPGVETEIDALNAF